MLDKKQLLLLALAGIAVLIAWGTLFRIKKMERMLAEPMPWVVAPQSQPSATTHNEEPTSHALQEDFDALLSGEGLSEMYEGTNDFWFTGTQN